MATKAQIEANRRNAAKSTGPRTDEGRAKVAQNALRHGLCSDIPLMDDETQEEERELLAMLRDEHEPLGPTEEILVFKMAEYFFNARRASYHLAEHLNELDRGQDVNREIGLLLRYQTTADRGYFRALNELRKIQKDRRLQEIGFVSQNAETAPEPASNQPSGAPSPAPQPLQTKTALQTHPLVATSSSNQPSHHAETPQIPLNPSESSADRCQKAA